MLSLPIASQLKAQARFDASKQTDRTGGDAVLFGQCPRHILFAQAGLVQVLDRASQLPKTIIGCLANALGHAFSEVGEVLDQHSAAVEIDLQPTG